MSVFRRIMLGAGIDIDALPDTQKIYYKANTKVVPKFNSLSSPVIANKWDDATSEGIIVCSSDITFLRDGAFKDKFALTSITIPDSVTSMGSATFGVCTSMESVTIGNGVTSIGDLTFYLCTSLTNVSIPDKVTSIGYGAFSGCNSLTNVTIPNSVTSIDSNAFEECFLLTTITIPKSVATIRGETFSKCTSMQYYDFSTHEIVPRLMDISAFYNIPSTCKIIVPDSLYDEWIVAENWSTYADQIVKASEY